MTLTDFIEEYSTVRFDGTNYIVSVCLATNKDIDIVIHNCNSEFEAKERCFLALNELIELHNNE